MLIAAAIDGAVAPWITFNLRQANQTIFRSSQPSRKTRDLGLAEGARPVLDRRLDDFWILFGCAEDRIEITERIDIAE